MLQGRTTTWFLVRKFSRDLAVSQRSGRGAGRAEEGGKVKDLEAERWAQGSTLPGPSRLLSHRVISEHMAVFDSAFGRVVAQLAGSEDRLTLPV
ncbi:hypothetical protein MHYP_G00285940 [Metynnis hypsauchen]